MYSGSYGASLGPASPSYDIALEAGVGAITHYATPQLQRVMDDNASLEELIASLQAVKNLEVERETLLASNKRLAEDNLALEPRLITSRQSLADAYQRGVQIQKTFESNKLKLETQSSLQTLDSLLAVLQTEAAKTEEQSEALADSYLLQPTDVETFVNNYVALRTSSHLRKVKAEKMAELLAERERQRSWPSAMTVQPMVAPTRSAPAAPVAAMSAATQNWIAAVNNNFSAPAPYPAVQYPGYANQPMYVPQYQ